MTDDPYSDLGGKPATYAEILARSVCGKPDAALTEQELAAKVVADRERMRRHDLHFSSEFIGGTESLLVSRQLARQMGHYFNDNQDALGDDE